MGADEGAEVVALLLAVPSLRPGREEVLLLGAEGRDRCDDGLGAADGEEDDGMAGGGFGNIAAGDEVSVVFRLECTGVP